MQVRIVAPRHSLTSIHLPRDAVRVAFSLAIVSVASCATPRDQTAALLQAVDSAGVRVVTITALPDAIPEWAIAPEPILTLTGAEAGDSSAFAQVGAVRWLGDGRLVVADAAGDRLFIFDSAGAFQHTLGRSGDGPAEFRDITTVHTTSGDTLVTFDRRLRRISFWHPDSGFARSVSLADDGSLEAWPAEAWAWQDSLLVVMQLAITPLESVPAGSGLRRWPTRAHLTLRDGGGKVLLRSREFDGTYSGLDERGDLGLPFSNRPFTAVARDRVYFGSGANFALSWLNREFVWAGDLRWPGRQEPLTAAEVEAVRADLQAIARPRLPPGRPLPRFAREFASEILPEFRPEIGRVLIAADGRLWVERFEPTRFGTAVQTPGDVWTILQGDGHPVARLRLPRQARLESIRGERVALVRWDSLEVQTVQVHAIVRP